MPHAEVALVQFKLSSVWGRLIPGLLSAANMTEVILE